MAQITRSTKVSGGTTLQASTLARAADVETDVLTVFTAHNNHDTGTSKWTVVSAQGASSVPLVADNSSGTQDIANFKDNGTTTVAIKDGGQIQAGDGSQAAPTYGFASDTDNGLYLVGANNPAIVAGGTKRLDISSTVITAALPLAMGSNKITGGAAATAATDVPIFSQIKYVSAPTQLVDTSTTTTTSATPQATGLTAAITPSSASNRIKITVTGTFTCTTSTNTAQISLFRGGSSLGVFCELRPPSSALLNAPCSIVYIDSPATTSSTTYTVKVAASDGVNSVQFNRDNVNAVLILEEIV